MGKRRGEDAGIDMQVKRDEYDSDADGAAPARAAPSAQPGGWDRADAATLAQRNIVKRKPREAPTGNPFKGINLLGGSSQPVTKPSSLFAKPSPAPQPASSGTSGLFGAAAKPSSAPATTGASGLFGASAAASAASSAPSSAAQPLVLSDAAPAPFASGLSEPTATPLSNGKPASGPSSSASTPLKEVAALNQSFCKWVDGQLATKESALLINGVRKYVNFAKNLQASKPGAASGSAGAASGSAPASSSLLFKLPGPAKPEAGEAQAGSAPAAASGSPAASNLFGASSGTVSTSGLFGSKPDASASTGGLFGSSSGSSSSTAGGLFGSASSTTSNLFGSSSGSQGLFGASTGGSNLFGGSAFGAGANGSSNNDNDDNDEDGQDDGAKEGRTVVEDNLQEDEELVLKVRANVKCLVNKAWESRGNGDLSVIKVKGSNTSMMVLRADSGRVVCTIPLYKGISPAAKEAKKNAMVSLGAIIYKEVDGEMEAENDGKPLVCMIKVKTLDDANSLCDAIKSASPQ